MNKSKVALAVSMTISIVQAILGWITLGIFGLCTVLYLFDQEFQDDVGAAFLVVCLVFDALGVMLLLFSKKHKKLNSEFKKYVYYISAEPTGSINNIAAAMGESVDLVKSNLRLMIDRNYFSNAYIDEQRNCIVISNRAQSGISAELANNNPVVPQQNRAPMELVSVTCRCCGAPKTITRGMVANCDFCGSSING